MNEKHNTARLPLTRSGWTLARYLATQSLTPAPLMVRAGDDVLHVGKVTAAAARPPTVYVVDDEGRYLGAITESRLAREVFKHLDPALYLAGHPRATTKLLSLTKDITRLNAVSLIESKPEPLRSGQTLAEAMTALYRTKSDELPVINQDGELLGVIRTHDFLREWVEDLLLTHGDETGSFY